MVGRELSRPPAVRQSGARPANTRNSVNEGAIFMNIRTQPRMLRHTA